MSATLTLLRDSCFELLAPTRCAGCDYPGVLLCDACRDNLGYIESQWSCKRCGAPYGYLICTECYKEEWDFEANYSLAEFNEITSRMVVLHKDHSERRLAQVIGTVLARGTVKANALDSCDLMTWIPATKAAYRRRGFDHALEVAQAFVSALGGFTKEATRIPLVRALDRIQAKDQRKLGREERAQNMRGTFSVRKGIDMTGKRIAVIDDVFTTGATLNEAALVLKEAGAREVRGITFARVW